MACYICNRLQKMDKSSWKSAYFDISEEYLVASKVLLVNARSIGSGCKNARHMKAIKEMRSRADLIEFPGGIDFEKAADICLTYMETGKLP